MKAKHIGFILLAGAVLAGCGGGGASSSSSTTPLAKVTITTSNAEKVANGATSVSTQDFNNLGNTGVQTSGGPSSKRTLYTITSNALDQIAKYKTAPLSVTGATTPTIINCFGSDATHGTFSIDTDNTSYITLTFTNCSFKGSATNYLNGTFTLSGSDSTTTTSGTVTVNLTATVGSNTIKYVGGFTVSETGKTTASRVDSLTGTSLVFSVNNLKDSLTDFTFTTSYNDTTPTPSSYSDIADFTASSDFTGGSFTFDTNDSIPFVTNSSDEYPSSGQAIIYGANSSALRITVDNTDVNKGQAAGTVTLEISSDNGTNWGTAMTRTWTQIKNAS